MAPRLIGLATPARGRCATARLQNHLRAVQWMRYRATVAVTRCSRAMADDALEVQDAAVE